MQKKGFTLIELLIALACGVLIFGGILAIFSLARIALEREGRRAELNQNGRIAIERISRELRQAEAFVTSIPLTDTTQGFPPPSSFEFLDGHDPDSLTYLRYHLEGTLLYRELSYYSFPTDPQTHVPVILLDLDGNPPGKTVVEDVIIAENLANIEFFGDKTVTIRVTLQNDSMVIYQTSITARNVPGSGD